VKNLFEEWNASEDVRTGYRSVGDYLKVRTRQLEELELSQV
jgi:hypothetical protein